MLDELSELQHDDEDYWLSELSFTVETRGGDDELVEREYTFTWGEEFEEWQLSRYVERVTEDTSKLRDREWDTRRQLTWQDADRPDVDVPKIVSDKLAERLECDTVTFQL